MKKSLNAVMAIVVVSIMVLAACTPGKKVKKTDKAVNKYSMSFDVPDSVSYSIGLSMANYLQRQGIGKMEVDKLGEGLKFGLELGENGEEKLYAETEKIQNFMTSYNEEMQQKIQDDPNFQPEPISMSDSISYSFGSLLGNSLFTQNINKANLNELVNGIRDQFNETPKYAQERQVLMLDGYFAGIDTLRINLNQQYLADNKAKEGIVTLPSGLQYQVITKGLGEMPAETDNVKVHYEGKFIDGKIFDSSYKRGEPAEFPLNGVISGWTQGVGLMPVGSIYILTIPYDLAYGERGNAQVPPKSTLIFKVELLEIIE